MSLSGYEIASDEKHGNNNSFKEYHLQRGYTKQQVSEMRDTSKFQDRSWTKNGEILPTIRLPHEDPHIFVCLTHYLYTGRYTMTSDTLEAPYIHLHLYNMSAKFNLPTLALKALEHAKISMFTRHNDLDIDMPFDFLTWNEQVEYLDIIWSENKQRDSAKVPWKDNGLKVLVINSVLNGDIHLDVENVAARVVEFHKDLTMALLEDRKTILEEGGSDSDEDMEEVIDVEI